MDFNQIRYFLAVSETLNFTRAAELCHVTQPALTQSVKRLELELGGELIKRDGRNTELTVLGHTLSTHFQKIEQTRKLVRSTAKEVTGEKIDELNIALMCTIGPVALGGMLKHFQINHPKVSLVLHDVTPSSITELLLSGVIDGVFCSRRNEEHSRISSIDLYNEPMVLAFAHDHVLTSLDKVPLERIATEPYIDRLHCEFRHDFLKYCTDSNLDLEIAFRSQREDWIQRLILDGLGVSVIPKYSILHSSLEHRPISGFDMQRQIEFLHVKQIKPTSGISMLIDQIEKYDWSLCVG